MMPRWSRFGSHVPVRADDKRSRRHRRSPSGLPLHLERAHAVAKGHAAPLRLDTSSTSGEAPAGALHCSACELGGNSRPLG